MRPREVLVSEEFSYLRGKTIPSTYQEDLRTWAEKLMLEHRVDALLLVHEVRAVLLVAECLVVHVQREALLGAVEVGCLLYTSPSPRDGLLSRMPSSA